MAAAVPVALAVAGWTHAADPWDPPVTRRRQALIDAETALRSRDPVLDDLMRRHGPCQLPSPAPAARRFHDLAESIAYQQLNGRAAATIWSRVCEAAGSDPVNDAGLLAAGPDRLRACGLSGSKTRAVLDLAERSASGLLPLGRVGRLDDEAVIELVTAVWGIGRWTAQMFLMFTLGRLDVWPTGDYGVRAGFARAWGLDELPDERGLAELGEPFAGSRSLVAWYCWRAIEAKDSART